MQTKQLGWAAMVVVLVSPVVWTMDALAQTMGGTQTTPESRRSDRANQPTAEKGLKPGMVRASKITGMNMNDPQGDKLGSVKDVLIDPSADRVEYAVISTNKSAGLDGRYVAVPWTQLTESQDGKDLVTKVSKDRLAKAPSFEGDKWPDTADPSFWEKVSSYFGRTGSKASSQAAHEMKLLRASEAMKKRVENRQNERLGTLEDIVFDLNSGRVRYAVLGEGGVLGLGEKYFAIPFNAFSFSTDNSKLVLNADKNRLAKAPGFDKNSWPDLANRQYDQQVMSYWGDRG